MKNGYRIFSGSGTRRLAVEIAGSLNKQLGKIEIVTFADSEKRIRVEENVSDKTVFVIASLSNPVDSHLVELCLIGDALKSNDCGKMIAVVPYYGYGRQDKAHREGEGVSARVMARLITAVDFDKVITVDLHSDLVAGYFDIPVVQLTALGLFADELKKSAGSLVVVSPDAGGAKRAQKFAEILDAPLAYMEKKRNLDKLHELEHMKLVGDVGGQNAVLVDDVVTSGSTLVKAAYQLKEKGAQKVFACVTHADFVDGTLKILQDSPLDRVYTTDSILLKSEYKFPKLEIVTLAALFASQIRKMA